MESGDSRVGRTTLTQGMFAHTAALPKAPPPGGAGTGTQTATPETEETESHSSSPPADAVDVWPGDDPNATETLYKDDHHKQHHKPFEKKRHDAPDAATDKHFNKPGIHNDPATRNTAARPGAVVHDKQGHTHGIFKLKHAHATRYLYVCRDGKNEAIPYDVVNKADLTSVNYKAKGESESDKKRLLLNPAMPRELYLPNHTKPVMCVLSWLEGMTAAWINVNDLDGGKHITAHHITNSVRARASRWEPDAAAKKPGEIEKHATRYVFRNDHVGQADAKDRGPHYKDKGAKEATDHPRVLAAGQKGGDNVSHYLNKDLRKPAFDADGHRIAKTHADGSQVYKTHKDASGKTVEEKNHPLYENVTRSVVSICMNLPEGHVPPLANDTATAGESFFVMHDAKFHREVPVFENGKKHSNIVQIWVFGHLAMRDGDKLVPDPNRRGWVPFRTLAETGKDLQLTEIEQRKP